MIDLSSIFLLTSTSTVTTTIYSPPSQATLNFWFFDLVIVGAIGGIFLFVTYWFQGDNDDSVQMLLIGIVTGSFVSFTAGVLPLPILVIMLIAYFVYALRSEIGIFV